MARHLQLTLLKAEKINAVTAMKSRTMVIAKASYKNTVYSTTKVEDMGRNPEFMKDGTNVFHFVYENETEYITLELFNRNGYCIGKSKLNFHELTKLTPEQGPEEKVLPVMVTASLGSQKQCGELFLTAQILQQQAMGLQGNLTVVLQRGHIEGLTSVNIFKSSKTTKVCAKLTYNHTILKSGTLEDRGNKFVWYNENSFTFIINSPKPEDALEIQVYNGSTKAGECKMEISSFIEGEDPVTRTEVLLGVNKNAVGSIDVVATFTKSHICRRNNSSPPENRTPTDLQPDLYPPPHTSIYPRTPTDLQPDLYPPPNPSIDPRRGHPHTSQPRPMYTRAPEQHPFVQTTGPAPPDQYAPSAPPGIYPAVNPYLQTEAAHGAPPGRGYFQCCPEIHDFVRSYH